MLSGGTFLIEEYLSRFTNVLFLCEHKDQRNEIWFKATHRYGTHDHIQLNRRLYLVDFGSAFLRFLSLTDSRNYELIIPTQAVIICHPDLLFQKGRDEQLVDLIKNRNERYGNTK